MYKLTLYKRRITNEVQLNAFFKKHYVNKDTTEQLSSNSELLVKTFFQSRRLHVFCNFRFATFTK